MNSQGRVKFKPFLSYEREGRFNEERIRNIVINCICLTL